MSHDLFRREALDARRGNWLGSVALSQPLSLRVMAAIAVAIAIVAILFLTLASYTRRSRVVGQLVPSRGLATVLAPVTGVVTQIALAEGARASTHEPLAVISIPRATPVSGDTTIALARELAQRRDGLERSRSAQRVLLETQARGFAAQIAVARDELREIEAEIATQREQVRIARETLERMRRLEQDRYVSAVDRRQSEAQALNHISAMQALQGKALTTRRLLAQLEQARSELPGQRLAAEASFSRDTALLQQEQLQLESQSSIAVHAPVDGIVSTRLVEAGQSVQQGQPLLSIIPGDGRLQADLLVPSRAVGFVEPGDRVLLRYQAFPFQKFGHQEGRVARVGRSALTPAELATLLGAAKASEPMYRVTVTLTRQSIVAYGHRERLRPGMALEADIMGESRTLLEWALEPLYAIKGKIF